MDNVRLETRGALGRITLTRPEALNALTTAMCDTIHRALTTFADNPAVRAVAVTGEGRAFCAGGDVVAVVHGIRDGSRAAARDFFRTEYRMNAAIATFPKPYVAVMDGVTMGGGVGLSLHARWRVATARTLWAMPETGIGMIPDVGTSAVLGRMGPLGRFLVLTGARLDGAEALAVGTATHFAASDRVDAMVDALADGADVEAALALAADTPGPARLADNRARIDRLFAPTTVGAILAGLDADGSDWAGKEAATIRRMSPTACALALELLRRGADGDVRDALVTDYRVVNAFGSDDDFVEGVRALLIDKDKAPRWRPATLDGVGDLARFFSTPPEGDLTFQ